MIISETIQKLTEAMAKYGDIELVVFEYGVGDPCDDGHSFFMEPEPARTTKGGIELSAYPASVGIVLTVGH